jgi:hypothetical protein
MVGTVQFASAANDVFHGLSVALQVIGIFLLLLGVAAVRSWIERTTNASQQVRRNLRQRLALRVETVRHWYATRRGRPFHVERHASDSISISDSVSVSMSRGRPDPEGLSDREWLTHVEQRVWGVQLQVDQLAKDRADDQRKLDEQRDQLRAEIREATQEGWRFITVGLVVSAIGIVLGAFA